MNKLRIALLGIFLITSIYHLNAQSYDLIVRTNGDSLICQIDSISDDAIYFKSVKNGLWLGTYLTKDDVKNIQSGIVEKSDTKYYGGRLVFREIPDIRKNSIYFELGGTGAFWTLVSYDRLIPITNNINFVPRIGLSYIGFVFPVYELNLAFGGNHHFFETGFGQYMFFDYFPERDFMIRAAGYRYHGNKGFLFRAAIQYYRLYQPDQPNDLYRLWYGASFGYCF